LMFGAMITIGRNGSLLRRKHESCNHTRRSDPALRVF
jgi:hypothetical protein